MTLRWVEIESGWTRVRGSVPGSSRRPHGGVGARTGGDGMSLERSVPAQPPHPVADDAEIQNSTAHVHSPLLRRLGIHRERETRPHHFPRSDPSKPSQAKQSKAIQATAARVFLDTLRNSNLETDGEQCVSDSKRYE